MSKDQVTQSQQSTSTIELLEAEATSPHNKAVYEAGKSMLVDSIKTGRDFCQFMITTSVGAIPVYLALLTFLLPKDYKLGIWMGIVIVGPALLFLCAALIFAFGYFPISNYFSLDVIEEIEEARSRNIERRRKLSTAGFTIFVGGALYAIIVYGVNIGAR